VTLSTFSGKNGSIEPKNKKNYFSKLLSVRQFRVLQLKCFQYIEIDFELMRIFISDGLLFLSKTLLFYLETSFSFAV